jgi:hypothetical protein
MKKSIFAFALAAVLVMPVAVVPVAWAQQPAADANAPKPPAPPTPGKPDEPPVVMNILTMVIIIAAVVGANLIPSKRGHQD